ncbi:hypothetical protein TWF694_000930 [Orbilia ellipsospora]|uniref:tRNA (adenine(58)-N(1))-methyltransferase catalytic subunit TRM61 n=1 Tax=Orbilia ellipsospora TaxID=2528407 RepID=A0AAV9XRM5_9PEZI
MSSNTSLTIEGDCLYLKPRSSIARARDSFFLPKIEPGKITTTHKGNINHSDLIGRRVRDIVKLNTGSEYLITFPTLEEHILYSERGVTPIYPGDAAAIVQSLDLHVSPPCADPTLSEPLEVLEAGTGHGSLTLQLARALSAGLGSKSPITSPVAILHTVERDTRISNHAEKLVKSFRRGIYDRPGLNFYCDDVKQWLESQITLRATQKRTPTTVTAAEETTSTTSESITWTEYKPFLSACVLDMPDIKHILPLLAQAMHPAAILGYWVPSITQITSVIEHIQLQRIPFYVEKVLEYGNGGGGAGARVWDVRLAQVRSRMKPVATPTKPPRGTAGLRRFLAATQQESEENPATEDEGDSSQPSLSSDTSIMDNKHGLEMVCRPKTGERTQGGGFYLLMRRIGQQTEDPSSESPRIHQEQAE